MAQFDSWCFGHWYVYLINVPYPRGGQDPQVEKVCINWSVIISGMCERYWN